MKTIRAYHFTSDTLRDGTPIPPVGDWLKHSGQIIPCQSGLHASECPFDALQYAPGERLHLVELRGDIQTHGNLIDKLAARERRIVASIDATALLWEFARWNARQVLHLWGAPQVVRDYLETGDESLRAAAWDAAWDAAWAAARDAARAAARDAAWDAARDAARAAAWDAAWAAARDAARAAAWDAAWAAARDAARDAARAAARDAAWAAARSEFRRLVNEQFTD